MEISAIQEKLVQGLSGIEAEFAKVHLKLLDHQYLMRFTTDEIKTHIRILSSLDSQNPGQLLVYQRSDGFVDITVLAFDYPHEFSLLTGILAGMCYNISSGDVFTYKPKQKETTSPSLRRRIIDCFTGEVDSSLPFGKWKEELSQHIAFVLGLLEKDNEESLREARHFVNELVVKRLSQLKSRVFPTLYPMEITVDNHSSPYTTLKVVAEDTPAFLYSLTNALSGQGVSIERVRIRTLGFRVEDEIDLLDNRGNKIEDTSRIDRIKFCVLLTKEFTHFLANAPDPFSALSRFEHIVDDLVKLPDKEMWAKMLANPMTLESLARLLGTSNFLWEDFIRQQYESLIPLLRPHLKKPQLSTPTQRLRQRLYETIKGAGSFEEQAKRLNHFKDQEIFLIDLDHILNPDLGFEWLSTKLTALAEAVVSAATELVYANLVERYGFPVTVAGLQARYAVMGLGKLGGAALGYASDIELMFIYSDHGKTSGEESITNAEFFEKLVRGVKAFIKAKREGIFEIDLRLRPYGASGPLAVSLENFCKYYGSGGAAHSYERLSLVRMRAIAGEKGFGAQVERLRDEMIYLGKGVLDVQEILELREKQFKEKSGGHRFNAKFSPGGLVDLEYGVQILQVIYGRDKPELRTPLLHRALHLLADAGVLAPDQTNRMLKAYGFLRHLINALRMLRGSAKDLFLPPRGSDELDHLARRMGYNATGAFDPGEQLWMDFESHTASVRAFFEQYFGRDALPGPEAGTVADLVLSEGLSEELREKILKGFGLRNTSRAYKNLRELAGHGTRQEAFARLAVVAFELLSRTPDPDMALNNWERFIKSISSPEFHYNLLLSQPLRLEIMLNIFSYSQFLSDTLIRNPGFLDWVIMPGLLHEKRDRSQLEREAANSLETSADLGEWLNRMRRLRRREVLRIGIRDMYLKIPMKIIMEELSLLAEIIVSYALKGAIARYSDRGAAPPLCILAMGKLGGSELNYSSDIDLLCVVGEEADNEAKTRAASIIEMVRADLSTHTEEGYSYRVDLRLRPYGTGGELAHGLSSLVKYYQLHAAPWELLAALKMRPISGDMGLGRELCNRVREILMARRAPQEIFKTVCHMRQEAIRLASRALVKTTDLKAGIGGIRDVEFMAQALQLVHISELPELFTGNTTEALERLGAANIISSSDATSLIEDYLFLRRVEHLLQIMEDRQIHTLPKSHEEMEALAKRLFGPEGTRRRLSEQLEERTRRIKAKFEKYVGEYGH